MDEIFQALDRSKMDKKGKKKILENLQAHHNNLLNFGCLGFYKFGLVEITHYKYMDITAGLFTIFLSDFKQNIKKLATQKKKKRTIKMNRKKLIYH